jgi:hypothetical protein
MPILIAAIGILAAVYFFIIRARNAAGMATELMDVANDVRLAARRFGFKRKSNLHPAESIEDPNIAIAGIATAFLELDDLPTKDQRTALEHNLRQVLGLESQAAAELAILGRWITAECGGADAAIARLSRKLFRLNGSESFTPLLQTVQGTLTAGSGTLNLKQKEALDDVKRAFHIR